MEPRPNSNQAIVFTVISGLCGAVIAGCFTASRPDNTTFEVIRNATIGGALAPILLYGTAFVVDLFGSRK